MFLDNIFFKNLSSLIDGVELADAAADRKSGRYIGQYRVSAHAIYQPDGKYLPFRAIERIVQDKTSFHVSGC